MKKILCLFSFLALSIFNLHAQEVSAVILDARTRQPIPFATVQYASNKGVITNEEGRFSILSSKIDSINISCLGYDSMTIKAGNFEKDSIYLKSSSIRLDDVFLSNKKLSGEEIIERVIKNVDRNYDFGLTYNKFFLRNSFSNKVNRFDLEVEETTIPELDQKFMDELEDKMPKYMDSYDEYLGDFFGNYDEQKVQLIKADKLDNPVNEESLEKMTERMQKIMEKKLGDGAYLKVKSGIFGVKLDSEDLAEEEQKEEVKEKTPEQKAKDSIQNKKDTQSGARGIIRRGLSRMFWKEDIDLDIFEKSRKYEFKLDGYAQLDNSIVYVVSFKPKRKADYSGKIYVNTEDFGVHRLDFNNLRPLKKFRLLGVSSIDDVHNGKMIFSRDVNGKYHLKYFEEEKGTSVGVERPLTFLVKKGSFLWKKKLDELDLEMNVNISSLNKTQMVIYETSPIETSEFESLNPTTNYDYQIFKKYNPDFWQGNNIIEPNAAIRSFTAMEEE